MTKAKPATDVLDAAVESARNPQEVEEDEPLIDGEDDAHTLWCVACAGDDIVAGREALAKAEMRLTDLEARDGRGG